MIKKDKPRCCGISMVRIYREGKVKTGEEYRRRWIQCGYTCKICGRVISDKSPFTSR